MLKTTSLVYVVAGNDLMTNASQIYKQNGKIMELLIVASLWYMFMTVIATYFQDKLEKKFGTADRPITGKRQKFSKPYLTRNNLVLLGRRLRSEPLRSTP
ncbi:hypothetical protein [Arthrobacter psychrolactophilus]